MGYLGYPGHLLQQKTLYTECSEHWNTARQHSREHVTHMYSLPGHHMFSSGSKWFTFWLVNLLNG
jgi:hypothetical protein